MHFQRACRQCVHAAGGSEGGRRESSLLTFAALFVSEKRDKRKVFLRFYTAAASRTLSRRRQHTCSAYVSIPLQDKVQVQPTAKRKNQMLFSLLLLHMQAQKKKLSKRKRRNRDFALCGARRGLRVPPSRRRRPTRSAYVSIPTAVGGRHRLLRKRRAKTLIAARQNFSQVLSKVK